MNTKNNKRRQATKEAIEKVFVELLQEKELDKISVSEICHITGYNRSTFYANYIDIYDLADKIREGLEKQVEELFAVQDVLSMEVSGKYNTGEYLRLFRHIYDNQIFYKTYFKLGYDNQPIKLDEMAKNKELFNGKHLDYHIEFFRAGLNAVLKKWLSGGCKETPEEIHEVLINEYVGRKDLMGN